MPKHIESKYLLILRQSVQQASKGLDTIERRMFGCDAFFTAGQIYGLIWKEGRIGLKLPDLKLFDEAMSLDDSIPWVAGNRIMSKWVLFPKSIVKRRADLLKWVKRAHLLAQINAGKIQQ